MPHLGVAVRGAESSAPRAPTHHQIGNRRWWGASSLLDGGPSPPASGIQVAARGQGASGGAARSAEVADQIRLSRVKNWAQPRRPMR